MNTEEPKEKPKEYVEKVGPHNIEVEKLVEGESDILTQMIDNTTFTVGGKTYEEGDKVELAGEEVDIFKMVQKLNNENKAIKQWLIDRCHPSTKNLITEIRPVAHRLARNSISTREKVSLLINMIHSRLGGLLPMKLDDDVSEFTVRASGQGENLNYTVPRCIELIGARLLSDQRDLSFCIARERTDSHIDMAQNSRVKFQPITVSGFPLQGPIGSEPDPDYELRLLAGVRKFLEDHPRMTKTLIMIDADLAHLINLDIQEGGRWERIVEYSEEVEPHIIYVLESIPGKDPKVTEAALSSMYIEPAKEKGKEDDKVVVKKTWKFQIRVKEKRVKETGTEEGKFHSAPEDQYEDLFVS